MTKASAENVTMHIMEKVSRDVYKRQHMNIGAGRIIYQDLTRITKAIADGDFFKNKVLISAIENCKKIGRAHV